MEEEKTIGTIKFDLYKAFKHRCRYYDEDEGTCTLLGLDNCNYICCQFINKIADVIIEFTDIDKVK